MEELEMGEVFLNPLFTRSKLSSQVDNGDEDNSMLAAPFLVRKSPLRTRLDLILWERFQEEKSCCIELHREATTP